MASYSRFRFSAQDSQISNSTLQLESPTPTQIMGNSLAVDVLCREGKEKEHGLTYPTGVWYNMRQFNMERTADEKMH